MLSTRTQLKSLNTNFCRHFHLTAIRCHSSSSSSSDPTQVLGSETTDQNGNATQTTKEDSSNVEYKQPINLNEAHLNRSKMDTKKLTKPSFKLKSKQPFDHVNLPSVPTTKYIDKNIMKKDILFTGYRPVLSPIKDSANNYKSQIRKKDTIPLTWNYSACKLKSFDDFSAVPQFIVDKLVPFNPPNEPGNEIIIDNLKLARLREENERKLYSKEVYEFIKHFRK